MPTRDRELICACLSSMVTAIKNSSEDELQKIVRKQQAAGATAVTVSAATLTPGEILWSANMIQRMGMPVCLEDGVSEMLQVVLPQLKKGRLLIKGVTLDSVHQQSLLSQAAELRVKVIAHLVDEHGEVPADCEGRLKIARILVPALLELGFSPESIYLDLQVTSLCANSDVGKEILQTAHLLKKEFSGIRLLANIIPIAFGLPNDVLIAQLFLAQLMLFGVDAFVDALVLNNDNSGLCIGYHAARMLMGFDPYCRDYILAYRNGQR